MDDIKTKLLEYKKDGDRYFLYFISIFLFIFFIIIIPLKHPSSQTIQEAINSINSQINFINNKIKSLSLKKENISSEDQLNILDDKLLEYESKKTILLKERIVLIQMVEKNVTIPILNVSVNQSTVLASFMAFILAGLSLILHYRNKFFENFLLLSIEKRKDILIPFWLSPIPLTIKNIPIEEWSIKNSFGLLTHVIVIYIGLETIKIRRIDAELNAINILIYVTAIVFYIVTIFKFVEQEWRRIYQ